MDMRVVSTIFQLMEKQLNSRTDFATLAYRFTVFDRLGPEMKAKVGEMVVDYLYHHEVLLPSEMKKIVALFMLYCLFNRKANELCGNPFDGIIYDLINKQSYEQSRNLESKQRKDGAFAKEKSPAVSRKSPRSINEMVLYRFPDFSVATRNFFMRLYLIEMDEFRRLVTDTVIEDVMKVLSPDELLDASGICETVIFETGSAVDRLYKFDSCPLAPPCIIDFMEQNDLRQFYLKWVLDETNLKKRGSVMTLRPSVAPLAGASTSSSISSGVASPAVINSRLVQPSWPSTPDHDNGVVNDAERMLVKALTTALSIPSQNFLLTQLVRNPFLPFRAPLSPDNFADLVENNPSIAGEVLLIFIRSAKTNQVYRVGGKPYSISADLVNEYLAKLGTMDMSVHSMEVLNHLSTKVELPASLLLNYIRRSIVSCEGIKDVYMQNRLVRLLCVFLKYLICNKLINVQAIFIELEAFCIEFARIKEAGVLFRLLKQTTMEHNSSANDNSITSTMAKQPQQQHSMLSMLK